MGSYWKEAARADQTGATLAVNRAASWAVHARTTPSKDSSLQRQPPAERVAGHAAAARLPEHPGERRNAALRLPERLVRGRAGLPVARQIDGDAPDAEHPAVAVLRRVGFSEGYRGWSLRD